jgi:hypothetical protein
MTSEPSKTSQQDRISVSALRFGSCDDIAWLRDSAGIFVFSTRHQKYWLLAGAEADFWDWIVLGHSLEHMIKRAALIADLREDEARERIYQFFRYLVGEGIWVADS